MLFFIPKTALAHCPLCTIGAVAIGLGAYKFGVSTASVGVGIGAFAIALGFWIAKYLKRQYMPYQAEFIAILSFATTVIPIMALLPGARSLYISFIGEYGTTIVVPHLLIGSVIGGILVFISPSVSQFARHIRRGKKIPFQGMAVTFLLLVAAIAAIEFGV